MKNNNQPEIAEPIVMKCTDVPNVLQTLSIDDKGFIIGPLREGNQLITANLSPSAFDAVCKAFKIKRKGMFKRGNLKYLKSK